MFFIYKQLRISFLVETIRLGTLDATWMSEPAVLSAS